MLPDWVSNPGPLTYESGALPITDCMYNVHMYVCTTRTLYAPDIFDGGGIKRKQKLILMLQDCTVAYRFDAPTC